MSKKSNYPKWISFLASTFLFASFSHMVFSIQHTWKLFAKESCVCSKRSQTDNVIFSCVYKPVKMSSIQSLFITLRAHYLLVFRQYGLMFARGKKVFFLSYEIFSFSSRWSLMSHISIQNAEKKINIEHKLKLNNLESALSLFTSTRIDSLCARGRTFAASSSLWEPFRSMYGKSVKSQHT